MKAPSAAAGRERLLDTAGRLFAEQGYEAVSTKLLAQTAGLTIGALYHHFASKLVLYQETLRHALSRLPVVPADLLAPSGQPDTQLTELVAWFSALIAGDSPAAALLRRELLEPHLDRPLSDFELFVAPLQRFRALMAELAPLADVELVEAAIISLTFGFANMQGLRRLLPGLHTRLRSPQEIARLVTSLVFTGLDSPVFG
ncbi:TetR/AcrR family transcriptional regulator [Novosphingobium lentum]|uniref:TetR/AcrR family transcriptional regulator n=1 Tax=Novosphingobium lentum TaxID=145287 RepID=UPI000834BBF0|nr:TetR/AcrR family transcriptional regulator [Novosphingobium lentum]